MAGVPRYAHHPLLVSSCLPHLALAHDQSADSECLHLVGLCFRCAACRFGQSDGSVTATAVLRRISDGMLIQMVSFGLAAVTRIY